MSETKRVTSTARKISRAWLRRLLWIFIQLDLLLALLALGCFCYYTEMQVLQDAWTPGIERDLELGSATDHGSGVIARARETVEAVSWASYSFRGLDGWHSVPLRGFWEMVLPPALVILGFEMIFWLGQALAGRRTARRLLRPLDRMAEAARKLGSAQPAQARAAEGERLHSLEDAISRISPDRPEEKLQMRDRDLQGLQDAINSLLKRMHESYRQQAQFVSDASHELRTPIAVIQGYAGMLDRWGKQDEKILDESIGAIKTEAAYMSKLVEQLLFLARGDTGRNRMEFKPMSLGDLMREVYEDCRLIDKNHDWRVEIRDEAPCAGDWDMLKQCARILTDNTLKYTPEGGVIALRAYQNPAGESCIEVQDSGIGISQADMQHIFDRFYRSDPARGRESGGTGLGLSIAKWIVDAHEGHFDVLSRENLGTRMTVCLPPDRARIKGEKKSAAR